jgi:hypothetical protein
MMEEFAVDENDLLLFFGVEPVERDRDEGFFAYEVADERGVTLRFSVNVFEGSVQTVLSMAGSCVERVSREGARRLAIGKGQLRCELATAGEKGLLTIDVGKRISVSWSSVRTQ